MPKIQKNWLTTRKCLKIAFFLKNKLVFHRTVFFCFLTSRMQLRQPWPHLSAETLQFSQAKSTLKEGDFFRKKVFQKNCCRHLEFSSDNPADRLLPKSDKTLLKYRFFSKSFPKSFWYTKFTSCTVRIPSLQPCRVFLYNNLILFCSEIQSKPKKFFQNKHYSSSCFLEHVECSLEIAPEFFLPKIRKRTGSQLKYL